jgi:ketosteroid isomerase-like protein
MPQPMSAEDRLGVMELIASYARCIDSGDVDGWVDNFMPDAVFAPARGERHGHDEIRQWLIELMAPGRVGAAEPQLVHFVGLPKIDGDSERATAQTYCVILDFDEDKKIRVPLVGRYEDTAVKDGDRWRFERRIIHGDLVVHRGG